MYFKLFLSINNSIEGRNEYSFLIKNTNYTNVILPSLIKLKDESLIAAFFSKIIFLSIPTSYKANKKIETEYYIPEVDLKFFFNNIVLFKNEDEKLLLVITLQILSLVKINKNIFNFIIKSLSLIL